MISRQCQGYPPTEARGGPSVLVHRVTQEGGARTNTHDWWRDTNEKAWVSARVHVNIYEGLEGLRAPLENVWPGISLIGLLAMQLS